MWLLMETSSASWDLNKSSSMIFLSWNYRCALVDMILKWKFSMHLLYLIGMWCMEKYFKNQTLRKLCTITFGEHLNKNGFQWQLLEVAGFSAWPLPDWNVVEHFQEECLYYKHVNISWSFSNMTNIKFGKFSKIHKIIAISCDI